MRLADGTYDNDQKFAEYMDQWIATGDKKYLWDMYPLWLHAIKSCMNKRLKNKKIPFFTEKAEDAAIYMIDLMGRNPTKRYKLMAYASTLAMYALYGKHKGTNWEDWKLIDEEYAEPKWEDNMEDENEC